MKKLIVFVAVMVCPVVLWADDGFKHQVEQDWTSELGTRSIKLGTSGGNILDRSTVFCCSGTLGSLVQNIDESGNPYYYVLSNNHVLARTNKAEIGEEVNQPGQIDQKCGQVGVVAELFDFVPIRFSKGRKIQLNEVDAAIALVWDGQVSLDGFILDIGPISADTVAASLGQSVQKSGRTTGQTFGEVKAVDVTVDVGYSKGCGGAATQVARFINQIRIEPGGFSAGGDSGSLVLEKVDSGADLPRAVGLLFAGNSTSTIANPIDRVLSLLAVNMVGGIPPAPGPTGSISGFVTGGGSAIEGATVSVDTGQSDTTASDGTYEILAVPTGGRSVTASATGFESQTKPATVNESQETMGVDFTLAVVSVGAQPIVDCVIYNTEGGKNKDKHLLITIRVVDDFGAAVSGAQVDIEVTLNGDLFGTGSGAITNESGEVTYSAKNTPSGRYETVVTAVVAAGLNFVEGSTPPNEFLKGTDTIPVCFCQAGSTCSGTSDAPVSARGTIALDARQVKARHSAALFSIPGVVGHGVGLSDSGEAVIEVYLASESASSRAQIPEALEGVGVRVVVTGRFEAF